MINRTVVSKKPYHELYKLTLARLFQARLFQASMYQHRVQAGRGSYPFDNNWGIETGQCNISEFSCCCFLAAATLQH